MILTTQAERTGTGNYAGAVFLQNKQKKYNARHRGFTTYWGRKVDPCGLYDSGGR